MEAWLDERLARRLAVVGIQRLCELMYWLRSKGFHWHRAIPQLGPAGAARIVHWLRGHEGSLGVLPAASLLPARRIDTGLYTPVPRIGIVPLERFRPRNCLPDVRFYHPKLTQPLAPS